VCVQETHTPRFIFGTLEGHSSSHISSTTALFLYFMEVIMLNQAALTNYWTTPLHYSGLLVWISSINFISLITVQTRAYFYMPLSRVEPL
jgi:hypothetical protein